ncbi:MAG: CPBP family intramembrane metalloprotease [Anaerolineae bacterium]|nr:CPBP family intramembrane metalloprotease [Anaerolineae bacterium]
MTAIKNLANNQPVAFVLLVLVAWILLGAGLVFGSAAVLQLPITNMAPQMMGTLGAVLILLLIAARLRWLRAIGIAQLGGWQVWLITLPLLGYMVVAYLYGFFGDIGFDFGIFARSSAARDMLMRQSVVGFVEETLFRGIVLYALVRVWGHSKRGLIAAVVVQAMLFGAIHLLQSAMGVPLEVVLLVIVNGILSGLWWGVLVLRWSSLWPVIVLHGLSNLAVQVKGLTGASIEPAAMAYIRGTLLELPLVLFGMWLLLRMPLHLPNAAPEVANRDRDTWK